MAMKKKYMTPKTISYTIDASEFCVITASGRDDGRPNDKWGFDDDGNLVPPGHNKNHAPEYRSQIWDD